MGRMHAWGAACKAVWSPPAWHAWSVAVAPPAVLCGTRCTQTTMDIFRACSVVAVPQCLRAVMSCYDAPRCRLPSSTLITAIWTSLWGPRGTQATGGSVHRPWGRGLVLTGPRGREQPWPCIPPCSAPPLVHPTGSTRHKGAFGRMWSGARCTHGVNGGRHCFEMRIEQHLAVDPMQPELATPHEAEPMHCTWLG